MIRDVQLSRQKRGRRTRTIVMGKEGGGGRELGGKREFIKVWIMRLRCQGCCRAHHHAYHGLPKAWAERSMAKIKANSLPPQRSLWAKTLRDAHGRHVLFFEERKEKEKRKRRPQVEGRNAENLPDESVQRYGEMSRHVVHRDSLGSMSSCIGFEMCFEDRHESYLGLNQNPLWTNQDETMGQS